MTKFSTRQISQAQQQIMDAVCGSGAISLNQALRSLFDLSDGVSIEKLSQVGLAEKFAQLILVDGEGLSAAFGERSIAVIDKVGNIAEKQR